MSTITDISLWTTANDGTGTTVRSWGQIINDNFDNLNTDLIAAEADIVAIQGEQTTQDAAIALNTAKVGITGTQASDITTNNAKVTYPSADSTKLSGIEALAEVNTLNDVIAGTNITIDKTDPLNPVIAASGWTAPVDSVNTQTWVVVLDADDILDTTTTNKYTTAWDISKLSGIEAWADVTDTANVTSAWALMDSEVVNLAEVKAFDSTDYATALWADDNYVTDAEKIVIWNTSWANSWDQTSVSGASGNTDALNSATTTVDVSAATAPTVWQVLTATGASAATWQDAGGGWVAYPSNVYVSSATVWVSSTTFTFTHNLWFTQADVEAWKYKVFLASDKSWSQWHHHWDTYWHNNEWGDWTNNGYPSTSYDWTATSPWNRTKVAHQANSLKITLGTWWASLSSFRLIIQQLY